jgi:hypothetical protein
MEQTKVRPTFSLFPGVAHCDLNDSFEIRRCQKSATNYDDRRAICKPPDQTIKGAVRASAKSSGAIAAREAGRMTRATLRAA